MEMHMACHWRLRPKTPEYNELSIEGFPRKIFVEEYY
jgi:hypothetical protein